MDIAIEEKDCNATFLKIISQNKLTVSSEHNGIERHL